MKRNDTLRRQIFCIALSIFLLLAGCGGTEMAETENTAAETHTNSLQPEKNNDSTEESGISEGGSATGQAADAENVDELLEKIKTAENGAGVSIHDPSIEVFDGRYYLFGSHMTGAYSDDLQTWTYIGNTYSSDNPLFEDLFADGIGIFDYAGDYGDGTYAVWAEDVIYLEEMKKYVMYFCVSSTYVKSNLCYAVADAPEGPYVYQGPLLYSGFTAQDLDETDVYEYVDQTGAFTYLNGGQYNNSLWPNCIDPAPFFDADGRLWMVYGSWSGGIFLLELDPATGLVIHPEADPENGVDPYFGKRLIGGGHTSIEGPYIQYDESAFQDEDGKQYLCYHSRFDHGTEYHEPCVKQVFLNEEGWPVLAPYTTKGETISETGYGMEEMAGTYFFINQGTDISDEIAQPQLITLQEDGTVSGSVEGTWESVDGTCYMKLTYEGVSYSGVFCRMQDEAGTEVMAFSAVGDNQSIWGAKYEE